MQHEMDAIDALIQIGIFVGGIVGFILLWGYIASLVDEWKRKIYPKKNFSCELGHHRKPYSEVVGNIGSGMPSIGAYCRRCGSYWTWEEYDAGDPAKGYSKKRYKHPPHGSYYYDHEDWELDK